MKLTKWVICLGLALMTTFAFACPKGQHPHGGTGSHHKGGYCSYEE